MHAPHLFSDRFTKNRGFALIVTLSLMILLTVIAVGLLSLSSITLRGTSASSARQTAQANARMAMMLAIGQLQKYAGPDQRITATADIAGGAGGIAAADGAAPLNKTSLDGTDKGLSSVQPGTRHWTGVWKNRDPASSIYTKTPSPLLLQWLVSGNEAIANVTSSGAKTPASTEYGLSAAGAVQDLKKAVVLVSGKTEGNKNGPTSSYVSAPLVDIRGAGASASKTVGRYGWWVGDEGVKAKINLVAPYAQNELATFKNFSTQRSGWESVAGFGGYPLPVGTGSIDPLSGVVSLPQLSLIANGAIPRTSRSFHSATTESYGVLADVLQGGLRLDLSAYLKQALPSSRPLGYPNGLIADQNIIPATVAPSLKGPKWQALKEFSEFSKNISSGIITTKPATGVDGAAISPTIVELRLLLGVRIEKVGTTESYKTHPCAKIAVTLANPYPYRLRWRRPLDIEITDALPPTSRADYFTSRIYYYDNDASGPQFISRRVNEPAVFTNTIFQIPGNGELPVGGAICYTIGAPNVRPAGSVANITVPLVAITPSNALSTANYTNVIELKHDTARDLTKTPWLLGLDIREGYQTSPINVEMRLNGIAPASSAVLRRIEKLELDNANYQPTMRVFTTNTQKAAHYPDGKIQIGSINQDVKPISPYDIPATSKPIPLQLYSFQMGKPGEPDATTQGGNLGLLGSTLRTYADFNIQATRFRKPIISYNPPPFYLYIADDLGQLDGGTHGGETGLGFTKNIVDSPIQWGRSSVLSTDKTVLFCPPAAGESLVSLAQFQHADLTADDIYASVGHQPGNALGNSYATPFVTRDKTVLNRQDYQLTGEYVPPPGDGKTFGTSTNYYDISYLLNASLWDTYFFSTIPATVTKAPLNPKIVKLDPADDSDELRLGDKSSSRLLINGAFNINSTSKDAWKAFLAGSKHLRHAADVADRSADALFPRSLQQPSPSLATPSGNNPDSFAGYRRLNDAQLDALAVKITEQVRLRGPFVSLSHFVNRALVGLTTNKELGRSGPLQSAIDLSGANIEPGLGGATVSAFSAVTADADRVILQKAAVGNGPRADVDDIVGDAKPAEETNFSPSSLWPKFSRDGNPGSVASILADPEMLSNNAYRPEQGFRSTGIPGWLTQADVLQVIGPSIAARSDTFKIRSYGEALDANGNVIARAWCEASVQRVPEYIDPVNNMPYDRAGQLGRMNQDFGRQFKCVSFRWLSSNEI